MVAPAVWDTSAGTHIYINGNILWDNVSAPCVSAYDSEALYGDTSNAHGYNQKAVYSNNISWGAQRSGLKIIFDAIEHPTYIPTVYWYNNTLFTMTQIQVRTTRMGNYKWTEALAPPLIDSY